MLDPTQVAALERARSRPLRVSGPPGSGLSYLARALAEDAAARGLSCLLVGDSPTLDRPAPPLVPPVLHPILAARAAGPIRIAARDGAPLPDDPAALRAALRPDEAALALRLLDLAAPVRARYGLGADEVEAAAVPAPSDPALVAGLRLLAADAALAAGDRVRPGATLGEALAARGGAPSAPLPATWTTEAERETEALRRALDPWAWRGDIVTVVDAAAFAGRRAAAMREVAGALGRPGDGTGPGIAEALRALETWRLRHPGLGTDEVRDLARSAAEVLERQAARLAPFLARHGARRLRDLSPPRGRPAPSAESIQRAREASAAAERVGPDAAALSAVLPAADWEAVLATPLRDLARIDAPPVAARRRAAALLLRLREAFAATGFGDLLAADDLRSRIAGAALPPAPAPSEPSPDPDFLDALLPGFPSPVPAATGRIDRHAPGVAGTALPVGYDVVVLDDEETAPDALVGAAEEAGDVVHFVGAAPDPSALALAHPHRQRDGLLADLASGAAVPTRLGAPDSAGAVVRRVGPAEVPDLGIAAERAVADLRETGRTAVRLLPWDDRDPEPADVVVAFADAADAALVRRAARLAREGVLVVCRESSWDPPVPPGVEAAPGWSVVADAIEGRLLEGPAGRAVLVREPAWEDLAQDTMADRVLRLRALGWDPVVDWIGSPREPAELAARLAASALRPDDSLRAFLERHPLDGRRWIPGSA